MSVQVAFPWRHFPRGYKRDTGYSTKSLELHGPPDVVFVHPLEGGGWFASRLDTNEELDGPFPSPEEAMAAADKAWPWTGPREPWWGSDGVSPA